MKLTKRTVDSIKSTERDIAYWDEELPGFGLRVKPNGRKSYIVQYRNAEGRSRRMTLGRHGVLAPREARRLAREHLASTATGVDPADKRDAMREALTVSQLADRYLVEHVDVFNKPSMQKEARRLVDKHIRPALGTRKVIAIERHDIVDLHRSMHQRRYVANFTLAVLSKMFNLAELWGYRPTESNPCRHIRRYPEVMRERFLSDQELADLGSALNTAARDNLELPGVIAAIQLLALTGCRVGEILGLRWVDVDLDRGLLVLRDAKAGGRLHPVGQPACMLLTKLRRSTNAPWVVHGKDTGTALPMWTLQNAWRRIKAVAGIRDVRLHDLRHTVGTYAGQTGANAFLIRDKLGHKTLAMTNRYVNKDIAPLIRLSDQVEARVGDALQLGKC